MIESFFRYLPLCKSFRAAFSLARMVWIGAALLALPLCAQQHQVSVTYDFTGVPICAPGTTGTILPCYDHFEIQNAASVLASIPIPVPSGSGVVSNIPLPFTAGFGTVYVVMVAKAADGTRIQSNPKLCAVSIPPNPPTGAVLVQ
jgi:hypothetical protein